jgi:hypothetical protein
MNFLKDLLGKKGISIKQVNPIMEMGYEESGPMQIRPVFKTEIVEDSFRKQAFSKYSSLENSRNSNREDTIYIKK